MITTADNAAAIVPFKNGESLIVSTNFVIISKALPTIGASMSPKDAASALTDSCKPDCIASNRCEAVTMEL